MVYAKIPSLSTPEGKHTAFCLTVDSLSAPPPEKHADWGRGFTSNDISGHGSFHYREYFAVEKIF
jgi:hypothetical protein